MVAKSSFMAKAFEQAGLAAERGEVPIGAVIVHNKHIIAANGNRTRELKDPTGHAEMLVIRDACRSLGSERLPDCDLYVTLEPCPMCATAISFARIKRLYYGAIDSKSGGVESGVQYFSNATCHHAPEIYPGIMETDCSKILKDFFNTRR